jgi:hypothetical protein
VAHARVDQTAGDERWAIHVVGDRGHECVVLVAEVGVQAGPVGERAFDGQTLPSQGRYAEPFGDDIGERRGGGPPLARAREAERAHVDRRVEVTLTRLPPGPGEVRFPAGTLADVCSVARAEDRLRQDEPDPPTVGVGEPEREREELHRRIRVRSAPVPAGAAPAGRGGHLRQERRIADHDVEAAGVPSVCEGVGVDQVRRRARGASGDQRVDIDIASGELDRHAGVADPQRLFDRHEEAGVAARRIDDTDRPLVRH